MELHTMSKYPDYKVSKEGQVYSIRKGIYLKPSLDGAGYLKVSLYGTSRNIHRLVAEVFIPNPEHKLYVNHKDGDKLNNHVDNLEWCTPSENNQHAQDKGLNRARYSGKQKAAARLNGARKNFHWVHNELGSFYGSASDLARLHPNLTRRNLSSVVTGRYTHHKGWKLTNEHQVRKD